MRNTLIHEIGHHFGFSDDDMEAIEFGEGLAYRGGLRASAAKPGSLSTRRASAKPASVSSFLIPARACPERGVKTRATLPPGLEDPADLPQPGHGVRPDLQGIDRERRIEAVAIERQVIGRAPS